MSNPFQSTEPWEVSLDRMLPPGNHVVDIAEAQDGTSSNDNPQIELRLANAEGAIRDWLVITEGTVSKIVALAQAAGVPLPEDDDLAEPGISLRLKQSWIDKLFNKKVGIVIREEPDYKDPTKTRSRVQGYVNYKRVLGSTAPNGAHTAAAKPTDDIPF
jgi:hypothetical protein